MPPVTFPNKFPGSCVVCTARVAAGKGETSRGTRGWEVRCSAHALAAAAPAPAVVAAAAVVADAITIRPYGRGQAVAKPASRLNDRFGAYLAATRAAGYAYVGAADGQVGAATRTGDLVAALQAAGFVVDVDAGLVAAAAAAQTQARADVRAADDRAAALDAALRARGLGLYPYQAAGVSWLAGRTTALLADDMGLGKTCQALIAAPAGAPIVVVCPAVAKGVWVREASKWRPDLTPVALSGRGSFRWPAPGEMVIINYDILPGDPDGKGKPAILPAHLVGAPRGCVVIADEAHAIKSSSAQRTARFRAVAQAAREAGGRTWLLTATPLLGSAPELWAIVQALGAGRETFGGWESYKKLWNAYEGRYGIEWGRPSPEVATKLQSVMLRRLKSEVLTDLPAKTSRDLTVEIKANVQRLCDKALAALDKRGVDLRDALSDAAESARGVGFEEMSAARAALAAAKLDAALDLVESYEEAGEPVVLFSAHRAPIDVVATRPGWAAITGETPAEERTRIEADFQAGRLKGVAATIKAGGVAITLTKACHAIFVDLEWTPALNTQAEDRIYRIGQSRGVQITRLVAEHALDQRIADLLSEKAARIGASVDAARRGATEVVAAPVAPALNPAALAAEATLVAAARATLAAPVAVEPAAPDIVIAPATECPF